MTHRERILRALRGEEVDFVPFTPRLDIWLRAEVRRGELPQGTDPDEIARTNGWALYKVVPDFMSCGMDGIVDRGIGIYHLPCVPYDVELPPSVEREVLTDGDTYRVVYHTPLGDVSTAFGFTEDIRASGVSLPWITEHII